MCVLVSRNMGARRLWNVRKLHVFEGAHQDALYPVVEDREASLLGDLVLKPEVVTHSHAAPKGWAPSYLIPPLLNMFKQGAWLPLSLRTHC